jgi:hypothetical protein
VAIYKSISNSITFNSLPKILRKKSSFARDFGVFFQNLIVVIYDIKNTISPFEMMKNYLDTIVQTLYRQIHLLVASKNFNFEIWRK